MPDTLVDQWQCADGHVRCLCASPIYFQGRVTPRASFLTGDATSKVRAIDAVAEHVKLLDQGWMCSDDLIRSLRGKMGWIPVLYISGARGIERGLEERLLVNPAWRRVKFSILASLGEAAEYQLTAFGKFYWKVDDDSTDN